MEKPIASAAHENITFCNFSAESKSDWSQFVEQCDEAWLEHLPDFIEALSKARGAADQSFSIRVGDTLAGMCVLRLERDAGGWILSGPGPAILPEYKTRRVLSLFESELLRRAGSSRCCAIRFVMHPCAPAMWRRRLVDSYLSELDFSYGIRGITPDYEGGYHAVSDLNRSVDEIFHTLTKGHKANIKKCKKLNVTVKQVDRTNINDSNWSDFLSVYRATSARRGFLGYSEERLSFLRQQLEKGRYLLFNSYFDTNICASILLEAYKGAVYYHSAGANEFGLSSGAMAHLHFEAMAMTKQSGFRYYCLGPRISSIGGTESSEIGAFKGRLGNERWDMLRGERILDRRRYYATVLLPKLCIAMMPGLRSFAVSARRRVLRLFRAK
jgi:lipid II:glycine glycyltransferase (peptidoglycan interpeptide bridge formation enzyme)